MPDDEVDRLRAKNAELRRLVRLLHPDPAPDPHTADWLQREGLLDQLRRCIHDADDWGRCSTCHGGVAWRPCLVDPDAAAKLAAPHTPASRIEADRCWSSSTEDRSARF